MTLNIRLDEIQIKITRENNEKLARIMEHPSLSRIKLDKKNFVNTLFDDMTEDELAKRYRIAIGLDPRG